MENEVQEAKFSFGQQVLFRDCYGDPWVPGQYGYWDEDGKRHILFAGMTGHFCIPLEGNEALLGKNGASADEPVMPECTEDFRLFEQVECLDDYKEEWRTGYYIKREETEDGELLYHKVLIESDLAVDRVDGTCIRKMERRSGCEQGDSRFRKGEIVAVQRASDWVIAVFDRYEGGAYWCWLDMSLNGEPFAHDICLPARLVFPDLSLNDNPFGRGQERDNGD